MSALKSSLARVVAACAIGVLSAIPASSLVAQSICDSCSTEAEISTYLNTQAQPPAVQGSNSVTVLQSGSNNAATSDVTVPSSVPGGAGSYFGNILLQTQIGNGNVSNLQAVGNSNSLATSQIGNNNNTSIVAYGSGNAFSSSQVGNNLSYTLQRVGNGQSLSVSQKN
jgi:hypothetical protein